jgi:D-aminopeptidase
VPAGRELGADRVPLPSDQEDGGSGSIIVIVATDAPLLPHQCARLAQRASLGIARTGGAGEDSSGDLLLAFAVGNRDPETAGNASVVPNQQLNPFFYAAIEATEQAIVNTLLSADTMTGRDGTTVHALPHVALLDVMQRYGRDR